MKSSNMFSEEDFTLLFVATLFECEPEGPEPDSVLLVLHFGCLQ